MKIYLNFLKISLRCLLFSILFFSCDIGDNEIELLDPFLRIYDQETFTASFIPIDVKQTTDGGYLILGETPTDDSNFRAIYIMRADSEGNFVSDQVFDTQFVQPIGDLLFINGNYHFFCMQSTSLQVHVVSVAPDGSTSAPIPVGDLTYPLSATLDQDNSSVILQTFNNEDAETVLSRVTVDGNVAASRGFEVGEGAEVEEPIIDHFTRSGRQFPFMSGVTSTGSYYFNGFFNFTFSLVFVELGSDADPAVLQGVGDGAAISSALHINANTFAASRYSFGQNYILPQAEINVTAGDPGSSEDLLGNNFPELPPDARVILKRIQVNGQNYLIYGTDTRDKQILLLAYNESTGELVNTKRLGFSIPYEIGNFTTTEDGGLAVVGTAFVAGRFPRICLFKLSLDDINTLTMQ